MMGIILISIKQNNKLRKKKMMGYCLKECLMIMTDCDFDELEIRKLSKVWKTSEILDH